MFYQNDDELVYVPVIDSVTKESVPASTMTSAIFLIATASGSELFKGRLNNEITVNNEQFEITVPPINYIGPVIIEMRAKTSTGKSKTIVSTTSEIKQTNIERE
jgi:hypothetical protein